ncbi:hypothetical protein F4808DRAFT_323408 [Astrocystis sublimbata]|nr:hypothetical protein F4808DRAFT_323408 [Astrocystis sublimbata]
MMKLTYLSLLVATCAAATDEKMHGEDAEGTVQGPVAFLWPESRPWSAATDNVGPCGSPKGVTDRTEFPLSQGSVALIIADEAWSVDLSVAYANDPTDRGQFSQQVVSVPEVASGHQCYKIADIPDNVVAGSNATIQLEYWSNIENEMNGHNQSFFACADITFVEPATFTAQVPCFNITTSDFNSPDDHTSNTDSEDPADSDDSEPSASGKLSNGATAGIAVGVIVASLIAMGMIAFAVFRRKGKQTLLHEDRAYQTKDMIDRDSVGSQRR